MRRIPKLKRGLKILVVFDIPYNPEGRATFASFLRHKDWKDQRDVVTALRSNGHEVMLFGLYDDVLPLIEFARSVKPDLVFNLCESFNDCRDLEPNLIAVFELLGMKYTGGSSESLRLCKDKGMTKKILSYHNLAVPRFQTFRPGDHVSLSADLKFPCIVKPLAREASEGISINSKVANAADCIERVKFLWKNFPGEVIVEEYIAGRELYIGLLGNDDPQVFPPRELFIKNQQKGTPTFLTYKGKWDKTYRRRWGIDSGSARPIENSLSEEISNTCTSIFHLLRLKGYARLDLRLEESGRIVFLEANPNPSISKSDDFAQGAKAMGLRYEDLIESITRLAIAS